MDHSHVFCKSHTMVLLLAKGLVRMFPCTAQKLEIHSYGVLLSFMWYTKQLLFSIFPCSGSIEMLSSPYPTSTPLLWDLSFDIDSLPFVRLSVEPLPKFGTFVFLMGIPNVVTVSSQISAYVSCQSWHISTYLSSI
jgi:hypothetical protein